MLKKILIGIGILIALALIIVFVFFYKSDLTKEDLADIYIKPASKFIELPNGATMHYRDEGNPNGPVLVMVHGGFGSLQNWEGWIPYLKNDFRLISMDLLAHGLTGTYPKNVYTRISERDAVHELVQKLGIKKYTVAGNSFGGGIALEMALEYPNEVEGLILVDSEGIPNGENGYDVSTLTDEKPTPPSDPSYSKVSWLESLGSKFIGPSVIKSTMEGMTYNKDLLTDDYLDYFGRVIRYKGNREAQILMFRQGLYLVSQGDPMDRLPRLNELKMPVLVMHGQEDKLVPLRIAHKFNDNIETSELAIVPEAGHMPMMEKPKETAEMVLAFFKKYHIGKPKQATTDFVKGELIIGFNNDTNIKTAIENLKKMEGVEFVKMLMDAKDARIGLIKVPEGKEKRYLESLTKSGIYKYVEVNVKGKFIGS